MNRQVPDNPRGCTPQIVPGVDPRPRQRASTALVGAGLLLALMALFLLLAWRNLLLLPVAAAAAGMAVFFCYRFPETTFLVLVGLALVVPLDLAVVVGGLPRMGPTRGFLLCWYCGAGLRTLVSILASRAAAARHPAGAPLPPGLLFCAGSYLLVGLVGCWFSVAPQVSLNAVLGRDLLEQILLGVVFCHYFARDGFYRRLMTVIMICTAFLCLFSYFEFLFQQNPLIRLYGDPDEGIRFGLLRARATFFHSIAYGVYLNLIFPLVWVEAIEGDTAARRRSALMLVVMIVAGSAVALSRAPWMCLCLEFLILCGWRYHRDVAQFVRLGVVVALIFSFFVGLYLFEPNFHRLFYGIVNPTKIGDEATEYYRWLLIKAIWEQMMAGGDLVQRVLLGYGPGAFQEVGVEARFSTDTHVLQAPDLHYVRLVFEYGVVAAAMFGILLAGALRHAWRAIQHHAGTPRAELAIACFCSLLGFILVNFTVSMFPQYPLGMLFWMVLALSLRLEVQVRQLSGLAVTASGSTPATGVVPAR